MPGIELLLDAGGRTEPDNAATTEYTESLFFGTHGGVGGVHWRRPTVTDEMRRRFQRAGPVERAPDAGAVPDAGALAATLWNDRADSARLLLQRGCPVDATEEATGQTALHGAFAVGSHSVARALKEHGADFNRVDKDGNTPLHLLAQLFIEEVHAPLVQLVLEQGVDPLARNGAGLLATDLAPGLGVSPGQDEPR